MRNLRSVLADLIICDVVDEGHLHLSDKKDATRLRGWLSECLTNQESLNVHLKVLSELKYKGQTGRISIKQRDWLAQNPDEIMNLPENDIFALALEGETLKCVSKNPELVEV